MVNPYFNEQAQNQYWDGLTQQTIDDYQTSQETPKKKMNTQDYANAIGSGLAIGTAHSKNPDDFTIDPNAGLIGSSEAFASSGNFISAITAGVTSQIGQQEDLKKSLNNLNTSVQGAGYDAYGRPVYRGGAIVDAQKTIGQLNEGEKAMTQGAFNGGTGLDPATLVFNEVWGNTKRLRRKRRELEQGIESSNKSYNEAEVSFRNRQNSLEDYKQRNNNNSRLYHLYRSQI